MAFSVLILIKKFRKLKRARAVKINILVERYTLWLKVVLLKEMEKGTYIYIYVVLLLKFWMVFLYLCAKTI